jgi:hypothetical protein
VEVNIRPIIKPKVNMEILKKFQAAAENGDFKEHLNLSLSPLTYAELQPCSE